MCRWFPDEGVHFDEPLTPGLLALPMLFGTVKEYPYKKHAPYLSFEQESFISLKGFAGETCIEKRSSLI